MLATLLLWRLRPTGTVTPSSDLEKRLADETAKVKEQQEQMAAKDVELRTLSGQVAGQAATATSLSSQLDVQGMLSEALRSELKNLQDRSASLSRDLSGSETKGTAVESAREQLASRLADLQKQHDSLRTEEAANGKGLQEKLDGKDGELRALSAQLASSSASAESSASQLDMHMKLCKTLRDDLKVSEDRNATLFGDLSRSEAKANATDSARLSLETRLSDLQSSHDSIVVEKNNLLARTAIAEQKVQAQNEDLGNRQHAIEALRQELNRTQKDLAGSLAKQQADDGAARQFESIGQEILKKTHDEAKKGVAEITTGLQKSSAEDLEKHAASVALTLEPLQKKLKDYDEAIDKLRLDSREVYGGLTAQLVDLQKAEHALHTQAQALTNALSAAPKVRGMYGEMILKQLVEFAGMQDRCHFEEQVVLNTPEGRKIPDMIVNLPGGQKVIVDAKATMNACVEAYQAEDDNLRRELLKRHCENVRSRVNELSAKNYFGEHSNSVEAVLLFLPAENLYATAMENDPDLTQYALERNIIVSGPNSLMLLLKVSNQLWQRASIEADANAIAEQARDIYKHASSFVTKFAGVGDRIKQLGATYNDAVGTLEGRLLPAGRRLREFPGVKTDRDFPELLPVSDDIRYLKSSEAKHELSGNQKLPSLLEGIEVSDVVLSAGGSS